MENWKSAWQPMVEMIGHEFGEQERWGADMVEAGAIRRYLEPLEFDCPLHYDRDVAMQHGYRDIIAPYTSLATWTLPPLWKPGQHIFASNERDAQPTQSPLQGTRVSVAPPTTAYFATDFEIDYFLPVFVGDRLARRGNKLVFCEPKETRVGCGAFTTWESEIINQNGNKVASMRFGMFYYNPHPAQDGIASPHDASSRSREV